MISKINNWNISSKIIVVAVLLVLSSQTMLTYYATNKMQDLAQQSSVKSLNIVTNAIFISLKNSMLTGDVSMMNNSKKEASNIKGVKKLHVIRSKEAIALFGNNGFKSHDSNIKKVFRYKKDLLINTIKNGSHNMRILKPMIATNECVACHVNQKVGDVIGVIDLSFSLDAEDASINETSNKLLLMAVLMVLGFAMIIYITVNKITKPIHYFQVGLTTFFEYIHNSSKSISKMEVHSNDEIGQMVSAVNNDIELTIDKIKADNDFLSEVKELVGQMKDGIFKRTIESSPKSESLIELKELINEVVIYIETSVGTDINKIINLLESYKDHDYTVKLEDNGKISASVSQLGVTITEMLIGNKELGLILEQNSKFLNDNVNILIDTSTSQSQNLNKTSNRIESITSSLNNTSSKTISMTSIANDVKSSSEAGRLLASESAIAMDDINQSTASIREAINSIDQIAFQTNILSLNAAVEAATAGEAGKGFAVVAAEVRNLAARSAESAREIKHLVDEATQKTTVGKEASDKMIDGYNELSDKIDKTIELINDVAVNAKEQNSVIDALNESMHSLNDSSKNNSQVANKTREIALKTSEIAENIVERTDLQKFDGKDTVNI